MSSHPGRILLIGGTSILQLHNHRIHHVAAQLRRWGYPVDIVGQVNFYSGPPAPRWQRLRQGLRDTVHARMTLGPCDGGQQVVVRKLPGVFGRTLQDLWQCAHVVPLLGGPYDVCIFGHPNNALLVSLLKRRRIARAWIYDDWDSFATHVTTASGPLDSAELAWREKLCVRNADVVLSVSRPLARLRSSQGAREVVVVPNGVDSALFRRPAARPPHAPTMVFAGSLYDAWGADLPLRAMPLIRSAIPGIRYTLVGAGPDEERLRVLAYDELRLGDSVTFTGRRDYREIPALLGDADIGVLTYRQAKFVEYASSLKAFEYMAAGLPVIATRVGDAAEAVERAGSGLVIEFEPSAFARAAIRLLDDPVRYAACSARALECAAVYDWEQVLAPLGIILQRYTDERSESDARPLLHHSLGI